jgi:hypothetical protein
LATVKGGHYAAYNWRQTVTTNVLEPGNNAPAGSKVNVPFNDNGGNPGDLYWNADQQKNAMAEAAKLKRGGSTLFSDTPHLRIDQVPKAGWSFGATLSLIGITPSGAQTTLWTGTWGFQAANTGKVTRCAACSIQP